jgi:molecular chaperone DnaJ
MSTKRDYYEVLGVDKTASVDQIKRAYRKCAMKYHPDRNPGDAEAERNFKECAEAFEVLGDAEKRQRYDQFGHEGLRGAGMHDFGHMNANDIFSMFEDIFGDMGGIFGGRSRGPRARRGYDLETEIEITLDEVVSGTNKEVEFTRQDICETCGGSGAKPGSEPVACQTCGGHGRVIQQGLGGMFRMETTCPHCRGRGSVVVDKCSDCRGRGRIPVKRQLTVKVPAGIHDGQAVRVSGEGEPPPQEISPEGQGVRGDLHVLVRIRDHDRFERDGDHLLQAVPVAFTQLALGAEVAVPTLDGEATVTIPPGTQHGAIFRIEDKGLPNLRDKKHRGDMVVIVQLVVPKRLNDQQKTMLRDYARTEELEVSEHAPSFWSKLKGAVTGGS